MGEGQGGRGRGEEGEKGKTEEERKTGNRGCQVDACQTYTTQNHSESLMPFVPKKVN